jgi:indole-3-glycerol phosphate synthase
VTTTNSTLQTGTILDTIVAGKREELERRRREEPLPALQEKAARFPTSVPFAAALRGPRLRLIAEVKKASPTKGILDPNLEPLSRARAYAIGGAAAISVLTEVPHFLGSLQHIEAIRIGLDGYFPGGRPPLLRKDFLFDPYHLYEARAYGADAVLLIAALLDEARLRDLLALAAELGLEALVEVHDEAEVERALAADARVIGINNRDLRTFVTTLDTTARLRPLIPPDRVLVSESGVRGEEDARYLRSLGVDAVLVGEALMTSSNIVAAMTRFMPA